MSEAPTRRALLRYAFFGLPLGFIGLPLYVHLPKYYADTLPTTLATIGAVMFFARLLDCLADPWIGYFADRFAHHQKTIMRVACMTAALGVLGLFYLPSLTEGFSPIVSMGLLLALTYGSYSVLMIYFYATGLRLSRAPQHTARVSAWREGAVIAGVLLASTLPTVLINWVSPARAYHIFAVSFVAVLALAAWVSLRRMPMPQASAHSVTSPWRSLKDNRPLRWIFALFFLNAIPPSITATLFLFFVTDILHHESWSGIFLGVYFLSAVLVMPLWVKLADHVGKRRALMGAMGLAIASFLFAYQLQAGDSMAFIAICVASGAALGGDLTLLPALLADALGKRDEGGGLAFGIWNFISKFTLALAAGIALPLLYAWGYTTPAPSETGLDALRLGYALLPSLFKVGPWRC